MSRDSNNLIWLKFYYYSIDATTSSNNDNIYPYYIWHPLQNVLPFWIILRITLFPFDSLILYWLNATTNYLRTHQKMSRKITGLCISHTMVKHSSHVISFLSNLVTFFDGYAGEIGTCILRFIIICTIIYY